MTTVTTLRIISSLMVVCFKTIHCQCPRGEVLNIRTIGGFNYNGTDHTTIYTGNVTHMIECLNQCIHQLNCDTAVMCSQTDGSGLCFSVQGNVTTFTNPTFTDCRVVSRVNCKNGGSFIDGICHCTVGFAGYRCEFNTDDDCHTRQWSKVYWTKDGNVYGNNQSIIQAMEQGYIRKVIYGNQSRTISFSSAGAGNECMQLAERLKIDFQNKSNMAAFRIVDLVFHTKISTWSLSLDTLTETRYSTQNVDMDWLVSSFSNKPPCVETASNGSAAISGSAQSCWTSVNTSSASIFVYNKGEVDYVRLMAGNNIYVSTASIADYENQNIMNPFYWSKRHFYADGKREFVDWYVKNHTVKSTLSDYYAKIWFLDECWLEVFQNSHTGSTLTGSIDYLIAAVKNGKSVRVVGNDVASYLPDVYVRNSTVTGVMQDRDSPYTLLPMRVLRVREKMSTSGTNVTCRFLWESNVIQSCNESTGSARWFVDTRSWSKILSLASSGEVLRGSKTDMVATLKEGKTARMVIRHSDDSFQALDINHIHILSSNLVVMDTGIQRAVDEQTGACQQWSGYLYSSGFYEVVVFSTGSETIEPRTEVAYKSVDIFIQT